MLEFIRIGTVESINYQEGTAKIIYEEYDNAVSFDLPLLSLEYNPPDVGEMVVAIFLPNDMTQGFIIGKVFNDNNKPSNGKRNIIRKDYSKTDYTEYDKDTGIMTMNFKQIVIKGDLKVTGNLIVNGSITNSI